jgi:hypothetical protein
MSKNKELLDEIHACLHSVTEDRDKLETILKFCRENIVTEPEKHEIPEKYKQLVSNVAEELLSGMICFVNGDTLETESVPREMIEDPFGFEFINGGDPNDWNSEHKTWKNCITVNPMESFESFNIMERFVNEVDDEVFRKKLTSALQRKKPFSNFNYLIEGSEYRQKWFDFRQTETEDYVYTLLYSELERD